MPSLSGLYYFSNDGHWDRPPVILIHGAGGNHLHWPPEIRHMHNQRIYAIDLPGHGKSEGIGRQAISDYAQSVLDFMQALKINKAVLVGHSMGGAIALHIGIHNPSRIIGLGLIGTAPRLHVAPEIVSHSASAATQSIAIKSMADLAFGPKTSQQKKEQAAHRMADTRYPVLHGDFLACNVFDVTSQQSKIKAPTLIICGAEDRLTPVSYSQILHKKIKKSILHIIPGAGHMAMLEEPQQVSQLLEAFLNDLPFLPGSTAQPR